jgi:hypothetical protein
MENLHWSDDDFVAQLYEVGPASGHLADCPECMRRWEWFRDRRERLHAAQPIISESLLAEQRRSIRARLEQDRRSPLIQPVSLLAALLLMCVILAVFRQAPRSSPVAEAPTDAQIFEEVYSMVSSAEPQAVEPLRSLFEEPQ